MNIVGPHGAGVRETTTRPTDTASGNALDTWFEDCVAGNPNTGTKVPSVWLNKVAALFRRAIRGMGVADVESGTTSDDMLLDAIKRGATLKNVGSGVDLYQGQDTIKRHLISRLFGGANVQVTPVTVDGETSVRISFTVPGSGPTGNTLGNVGDGADVYKGTNALVEELRGIKGIGPVSSAVNGDNVEIGLTGAAWTLMLRNANSTGQQAATTMLALTEETSPAAADYLLLGKNADGALRKMRRDKLLGFGEIVASGWFQVTNWATNPPTVSNKLNGISGMTWISGGNDFQFTFSSALADEFYMVHRFMTGSLNVRDFTGGGGYNVTGQIPTQGDDGAYITGPGLPVFDVTATGFKLRPVGTRKEYFYVVKFPGV